MFRIVILYLMTNLLATTTAIYPLTGWNTCAVHVLQLSSDGVHVLSSPNYPHQYPSGACARHVVRPAGSEYRVSLVCVDVDLDSVVIPWLNWRLWGDFLTLSGRAVVYGQEWSQCGTTPMVIDSPPGQHVELEFAANWAIQRRGYTCVARSVRALEARQWRLQQTLQRRTSRGLECGRALISKATRIVDGEDAKAGEYPFMAYLVVHTTSGGRTYCAGTLISHRHVMTAAHCLQTADWAEIKLGTENLGQESNRSLLLISRRFTVHQLWSVDKINREHDIGLITLDHDVVLSRYIQPVCLPTAFEVEEKFEGLAVITGWGQILDSQIGGSMQLQAAKVRAISNCECLRRWPFHVTPLKICSRPTTGKQTHCYGDSGGPLLFLRDGHWVQVGIISFTSPTGCVSAAPAGYTRVAPYLQWIQNQTNLALLTL